MRKKRARANGQWHSVCEKRVAGALRLCESPRLSMLGNGGFLEARSAPATPTRSGLTLLEIVLSLGIFFGAMAALSQLAWNGSRAAVQARLKTQATIRCEAKMNDVLAGIEGMQSHSGVSFPDDSNWTWSLVITPSSHKELVQLDLIVSHGGKSRLANASVSLRRWARTQSQFVEAAVQQKDEAAAKVKQ